MIFVLFASYRTPCLLCRRTQKLLCSFFILLRFPFLNPRKWQTMSLIVEHGIRLCDIDCLIFFACGKQNAKCHLQFVIMHSQDNAKVKWFLRFEYECNAIWNSKIFSLISNSILTANYSMRFVKLNQIESIQMQSHDVIAVCDFVAVSHRFCRLEMLVAPQW